MDNAGDSLTAVVKGYCFRLMPRRKQHLRLSHLLESQRLLYNAALEERIDAFRKTGKGITRFDQYRSLTQIRSDDPDVYGAVPVSLSRDTLRRLDEAFKGFFRRVACGQTPGFPRFRSMQRWASFGFTEFSGITFKGNHLRFSGMPGALRVHMHRQIPREAVFLGCHFKRDAKGWLVSFQVREMVQIPVHAGPAVGLDLGITQFAALSDGTVVPSFAAARRSDRALKRVQRALQRSFKDSSSRRVRKQVLARLHLRVANARETFLHQASAKISRTYSLIGVEKLPIRSMSLSAKGSSESPGRNVSQKSALNRGILDAGWRKFTNQIRYKAAWAGGRVVEVNPRYTSQLCSSCGALVDKALSERVHGCSCGLRVDRDVNAARNIRNLALADEHQSITRTGARP